jgi:serine O-acetyltransferase
MRLAAEWRVPLVPMVLSRLIRHVYGAEIHWRAKIAPGVSIVHGVGLVLSHAAEVGPGCILFQNVTLGESIDAASGRIGAPRLGAGVHVGPGATLLGPIEVGPASKVAAGVVLMESVPPSTLVMPPKAVISTRRPRTIARVPPAA